MVWGRSVSLVLSTAFGAPMPGRHGSSIYRAEGALSSVAVRSGARIFECPVYIHPCLLCRLGEWLGLVHALWRSRIETLAARASPGPDSVVVIRGPELLRG